MLYLDVETYPDYFLIAMLSDSGQLATFERYPNHDFDSRTLRATLARHTVVTFNGNSYDLPMIAAALDGWDNAALKRFSDLLIKSKKPAWAVCRDAELRIPDQWDHIDLINVAPGSASLKIYGGRMHAPKLQDLPYDPDDLVDAQMRDNLRRYCVNDLETTRLLHEALTKAVTLREQMGEQYGMDLRSKSDAQIAETVIKSELTARTGKRYAAPKMVDDYSFRYRDPGVVRFDDPELQAIFERMTQTDFTLSANGGVAMPDWIKGTRPEINGRAYQMGIGGLHSMEKRQCVRADDDHFVFELDVASYYPNIILQQQLAPETMGAEFLDVYGEIVKRRLDAKASGDKSTADSLKIAVNGSFGKLGSKYSALYSPDLLIQTTVTGQLALLMLIERVTKAGAEVVSANTDGIVVRCRRECEYAVEAAAFDWMLDTTYELERTDYRLIASRDVNNYLAVKSEGGTKGKGAFADPNLMKNPDGQIVYSAVSQYAEHATPIEQSIKGCDDLRRFVTVRQVKGGAVWRDKMLGKAVRWYRSREVPEDECIRYASNGNKVPRSDGGKPVMDLPDSLPGDIDYEAYITDAEKLLSEVGLA